MYPEKVCKKEGAERGGEDDIHMCPSVGQSTHTDLRFQPNVPLPPFAAALSAAAPCLSPRPCLPRLLKVQTQTVLSKGICLSRPQRRADRRMSGRNPPVEPMEHVELISLWSM